MIESFSFSELEGKDIPERKWLVDGWIPELTTTALYGDGGTGKSLLAMQLMTCCATGKRFLNKDTKQCSSLGVFCEDLKDEIHRRQEQINNHYEISWKDLTDIHALERIGHNNSLMNFEFGKPQITDFYKELLETSLSLEVKLIIIDTAADTYVGNENNRGQVRAYVQLLNGLAQAIQGTVVLLAHPSVAGMATGSGVSGSTAWSNSVRSRLYLNRPKKIDDSEDFDTNIRELSHKKANYSALDLTPTRLLWEEGVFKIKLEDNDFVIKIEEKKRMSDLLECVKAIELQGKKSSDKARASNYLPKIIANQFKDVMSFTQAEKAMYNLFNAGLIVNKPYGPPSHETTSIEIGNTTNGLPKRFLNGHVEDIE